MQNILNKLKSPWKRTTSKTNVYRKKTTSFIANRPFASFIIMLAVLFGLIILGNIIRKPPAPEAEKKPAPKKIEAFRVGDSPRVSVQASVEKTGVITIYAQTAGIVQDIYASEGERVGSGATVAWLSSTYQGGSPASVSRELAQKNASFQNDTYDIQKDLISKQRDIASKSDVQASDLRNIARRSLDETRNLANVNTDIVRSVDIQIAQLRENNANGANDAAILQLEQGKIAAQGSLAQVHAQLQQADYSSNEASPPAQLATASRDLTLRQLDLQEKSTDLQRDVANLNLKLARVSEQLYYPATPCDGVVERVYVTAGDSVAPGTKIATIRADRGEVLATAMVDQNVAARYARAESSLVKFADGTSVELAADYVPTEATDGTLSAIRFTIPEMYASHVSNKGYVSVALPLGRSASVGEDVYVPLDSVYQTQDSSYIFVAHRANRKPYTARTQEVTLGEVSGSFVRVTKGVGPGDVVIVTRSIQEDDEVSF